MLWVILIIGIPELIIILTIGVFVIIMGTLLSNDEVSKKNNTYYGNQYFPIADGFDFRYSSGFGKRIIFGEEDMHYGQDLACDRGTPIISIESGTVINLGINSSFSSGGNSLTIQTSKGYSWFYCHMRDIKPFANGIKLGSKVRAGQVIGYVGSTGRSTGNHLHLGKHMDNGKRINPRPIIENLVKIKVKKLNELEYATSEYPKIENVANLNQKEFINKVANESSSIDDNIFNSITIAQAILESNWGKSGLTKMANNLFGIKAGTSWTGQTIAMETREQTPNGNVYIVIANFRAYPTWRDSIIDHHNLLKNVPTYSKNGVFKAKNYSEQAIRLQKAGYATDIRYSNKLIDLIEGYKLYEYD